MPYSVGAAYPVNSLLAAEIAQQPRLWMDTLQRVRAFLGKSSLPSGPVVLTGAGTSAYAGQSIAAAWPGATSIATTDLILFSADEIRAKVPGLDRSGLVISLARSGDSPESAGVVRRLQKLFPKAQHIAITCNAEGKLAHLPGVRVLLLSPDTNDRSLAMTASFSNLTLAGMLLLHHGVIAEHLPGICKRVSSSLEEMYGVARTMAAVESARAVVLTSSMHGLAAEASLKLLELTAGDRVGMAEGFLAFRHGPMSILRKDTPVLCYTSNDPQKLSYEEDLVRDLSRRGLGRIALIGSSAIESWPHDWIIPAAAPTLPDGLRTPFEVVFAQLFAYCSSAEVNVDPDNPSPNGEVTRVVRSFAIRP